MHPVLAAMLTQTVTQAPLTGHDAYGSPTYGPAVSRPCRIEERTTTALTPQGPQRVPQTRLFLNGNQDVNELDQLTLPNGDKPSIQTIERWPDLQGQLDTIVVYL